MGTGRAFGELSCFFHSKAVISKTQGYSAICQFGCCSYVLRQGVIPSNTIDVRKYNLVND
ncbi:hypothetical protein BC938DRAFT_478887 [Jimgerdemannia flammicorona]|uniref:Uncharacterized protein n=1 Tax=Jimgerdemannia flammicorona TaxID=994334 RepID=A0A433QM34_9FUNG|nr:hypothetical protein BC938DRAFT_478887 [Jimgerdemannia flammicorona]